MLSCINTWKNNRLTQISKKLLKKNLFYELFDNFDWLIVNLNSREDVFNCFKDLLTKHEKIMIAKRVGILLLLHNELTIREIQKIINVSSATIVRYKRLIDENSESYKIIIKKMEKMESTRRFYEKIHHIYGFLEAMFTARSNMRSRARLMTGNY